METPEEMQDPTVGRRATPELPVDQWPRQAEADDLFDETSDDTFTDEVTIPFKPRRARPRNEAADWPPRAPSTATGIGPGDHPDQPTEAETVHEIPSGRRSIDGPGQAGRSEPQAVVLTVDRPPPIARPWVPRRSRVLDANSIVGHRRSWTSWLAAAILLLAVALVVGLAAFFLTAPTP